MCTSNDRYRKLWTAEEDQYLIQIVTENQGKNWPKIASELQKKFSIIRRPKQCRERWINNLMVGKEEKTWSESDIALVFKLQKHLRNKWSKIAKYFEGRSSNSIKNLFYSTIRRNLRRFNKGKKSSDKIRGKINQLMQFPKVREILSTSPYSPKKKLREMQLDKTTLDQLRCNNKENDELNLKCFSQGEFIFTITSRNKSQAEFEANSYSDYSNFYSGFELTDGKEDIFYKTL
ncbi:hypothetical protein SteCoe_35026 [Stentor coeruleus]|uniref:Myb-like DNA-binding domain containing protein n=1 Tax=Stentor coeruleus TaxID=5963 RepID=A0A1R2AT80_9CILI|nr:hypothetical protein SteCoe_35026 [Stentor coeruleus]